MQSASRHGARGISALLTVIALAGCGAAAGQDVSGGAGPSGTAGASGAAARPAIAVGSSSHVIEVGGVGRTFIVYRPAALPASAPLVVMLHGGFGSARQAHQWPGAAPNLLAQRLLHTDPPSTALNATRVIWQFFAAHPR